MKKRLKSPRKEHKVNKMWVILLFTIIIWIFFFLKPLAETSTKFSDRVWSVFLGRSKVRSTTWNIHDPENGIYLASHMIPSLDSVEWNTEIRESVYNKLPPVLSYGLSHTDRMSFVDPILYTDSHKYVINEKNNTIHSLRNEHVFRRRDMPKMPQDKTNMLPQARINQFRQYHDVVEVFSHFAANTCFGNEMFMIVEDDFQLCPDVVVTEIPKINKWARKNWDRWGAIRIGFGLSGVIVRCTDMPALVRYLEEQLLSWHLRKVADGKFAIDWHVSTFFHTQVDRRRRMYTFHANLLQHIKGESTLWKGVDQHNMEWRSRRQVRLFETCGTGAFALVDSGLYIEDRFDEEHCYGKVFSPCDTVRYRQILNAKKSVAAVAGMPGKNCDDSCPVVLHDELSNCDPEYFQSINKCSYLHEAFFDDGTIHNCKSVQGNDATPLVAPDGNLLINFHKPGSKKAITTSCSSKPASKLHQRLCPCIFGEKISLFKSSKDNRLSHGGQGKGGTSLPKTAVLSCLVVFIAISIVRSKCFNGKLSKSRLKRTSPKPPKQRKNSFDDENLGDFLQQDTP
jgi:hypothetical protein